MAEVKTAFVSVFDKSHVAELSYALNQAECEVFSYGGTLTRIHDADVPARKTYEIVPEGYTTETLPSGIEVATLENKNREVHARAIAERVDRSHDELIDAGQRPIDFVYVHPKSAQDPGARRILSAAVWNQNCLVISSPPEALSMIQFIQEGTIPEATAQGFRANTLLRLADQFRDAGNTAFLQSRNAR